MEAMGAKSSPRRVAPRVAAVDPNHVKSLAAAYHTSFALLHGGTVRAWGQGQGGELGIGLKAKNRHPKYNVATAVAVKGLKAVTQITASNYSTGDANSTVCALTKGGTVYCWGEGDQIPLQSSSDQASPVEVPALKGAKSIGIFGSFGCAIMGDDTVKCWGSGSYGQLGDGAGKESRMPVTVAGVKGAVAIGGASYQGCAVLKTGKVMCWGQNNNKQVSPGVKEEKILKPVVVPGVEGAVAVQGMGKQLCAIKKDKSLMCWGRGKEKAWVVASDVVTVSGYNDNICFVKTDGFVYCLGTNYKGQLGQGTIRKPNSSSEPLKVKDIKGAVAVAVGYDHVCAATKAGKAYCWGQNLYGELGDATLVDRGGPVQVKNVNLATPPSPSHGYFTALEESTAQKWPEKLPKGCKVSPTLDVKYFGYVGKEFKVKTAYAKIDKDGTIKLSVANYHAKKASGIRYPRGNQFLSIIWLSKIRKVGKKEKEMKADRGVYNMDGTKKPRRTTSMSRWINGTGSSYLSRSPKPTSQIKLTRVGKNWVCGEMSLDDANGTITGTFAAAVIQKKK